MKLTKGNESGNDMNLANSPFFGINNDVAYWGFSQRGESHKQNGYPCQDSCLVRIVQNTPFLIAAMADGLGSCALSHYGASTAVQSAANFLENNLAQIHGAVEDKYMGELLRAAMRHAYKEVNTLAKKMEQLEYSFQSTLTLTVYDGDTLYISHVGDDGIVVLTEDGILELVTSRLKGEEASSVYPLQSGPNYWQVFKIDRRVSAYIMATDGVLDAFVRGTREENRIYYPFIEPALTQQGTDSASIQSIQQFYYQYMAGDEYRRTVTDDLTLIVVTNLSRLPNSKLPVFDKNEWDRKTRVYQKELDKALYVGSITDSSEQENVPKKQGSQEEKRKTVPSSTPADSIQTVSFTNRKQAFSSHIRSENTKSTFREATTEADRNKIPVIYPINIRWFLGECWLNLLKKSRQALLFCALIIIFILIITFFSSRPSCKLQIGVPRCLLLFIKILH